MYPTVPYRLKSATPRERRIAVESCLVFLPRRARSLGHQSFWAFSRMENTSANSRERPSKPEVRPHNAFRPPPPNINDLLLPPLHRHHHHHHSRSAVTIYTKLTSSAVTHFTDRFLLPNSEILTSPITSYAQLTNSVPGSSSPPFSLLTKNPPVATTIIHTAPSKYRTTLFNPHQSTSSKHPSFKHYHNRPPLSRYRSSSTMDLFSPPVRKPNGGYTM